jgi:hypothetical protein
MARSECRKAQTLKFRKFLSQGHSRCALESVESEESGTFDFHALRIPRKLSVGKTTVHRASIAHYYGVHGH